MATVHVDDVLMAGGDVAEPLWDGTSKETDFWQLVTNGRWTQIPRATSAARSQRHGDCDFHGRVLC